MGFSTDTSGKEPVCQCRRHKRLGLIPRSGRSPGGGNGSPLQFLPMNRGTWWATVHSVAKSQTQLKQLSTHTRAVSRVIFSSLLCSPFALFLFFPFFPLLEQVGYSQKEREASSKLIITSKLNLQLNKHMLDFLGKFQFQVFYSLSLKSFSYC